MRASAVRRTEATGNPGVYLGTIAKVKDAVCYVEVPRLAKGYSYGPAPYPSDYAPSSDNPLTKGDRVVVGFIEGGHDDLVVLARLTPGNHE